MRSLHLPASLHWLEHPLLRYSVAILWTVFFFIVLTQSSYHPVINTGIPPGPPSLEREIVFTSLHIMGFAWTTMLWWWVTGQSKQSLIIALVIALTMGVVTEYLQVFAGDRNVTITDVIANFTGATMAALFIRRLWQRN